MQKLNSDFRKRAIQIICSFFVAILLLSSPTIVFAADGDADSTIAIFTIGKKKYKVDQESKSEGFDNDYEFTSHISSYTRIMFSSKKTSMTIKFRGETIKVKVGEADKTAEDDVITVPEELYDPNSSGTAKAILSCIEEDPDTKAFTKKIFSEEEQEDGKDQKEAVNYLTKENSAFLAESMIEAVLNWFMSQLGDTLDSIVYDFTTEFGPDIGTETSFFASLVPANVLQASETAFLTIGWALLIIICLMALIFSIIGGITGYEDQWYLILGRTFFGAFLVLNAKAIMQWVFSITWGLMSFMNSPEMQSMEINGGKVTEGLINDTSDLNIILQAIFAVMIIWNLLKLLLEIIERYLVVTIMYYVAPVAFATIASSGTMQICYSFMKMLGSQLFIMVLNMWFLKIVAAIMANGDNYFNQQGETTIKAFFFYCGLLGVIKVAQRIDEYMSNLGMSVARTGGSLASTAMGVMAGLGTTVSMARTAISGGRTAMRAVDNKRMERTRSDAMGIGGQRDQAATRTFSGAIGDAVAKKTGNQNFKDARGNVDLGLNSGSAMKDFAKTKDGVLDKGNVERYLNSGGFKMAEGTKLTSAKMQSNGGGSAIGTATFKNSDGSISTMNLNTQPQEGYQKLAQMGNDTPLYGKLQPGSPAVGISAFRPGDSASMPLSQFAQETGSLTNEDAEKLGIFNNKGHSDAKADSFDAPMGMYGEDAGFGVGGDNIPEGISQDPISGMAQSYSIGNEENQSFGDMGINDRNSMEGLSGLNYDNAMIRPIADGNGYEITDSTGSQFLGTLAYQDKNAPVNGSVTDHLGNQMTFYPERTPMDYANMSKHPYLETVFNVNQGMENIGDSASGFAAFELPNSNMVFIKDPAYFEKGKNDKVFSDHLGHQWYAEETEKKIPSSRRKFFKNQE